MSQQTDCYVKAYQEFDKAQKSFNELVAYIRQVAERLNKRPYKLGLNDADAKFKWPTAENLDQILEDIYQKQKTLENAWQYLSTSERNIMCAPDTVPL